MTLARSAENFCGTPARSAEIFFGTVFVEDLARVLVNPEGWRLHLARLCEVRGWIPSSSLACWEGDLELKHSAPGSDSGARANSGQDAFFGCRFAPEKSPPQDQSGRAGGLTRRVCVKLEVGSPQQVSRAGRETLKSSTVVQQSGDFFENAVARKRQHAGEL